MPIGLRKTIAAIDAESRCNSVAGTMKALGLADEEGG
jgi:hypothetical protein